MVLADQLAVRTLDLGRACIGRDAERRVGIGEPIAGWFCAGCRRTVLNEADMRLIRAKREGRNRVVASSKAS